MMLYDAEAELRQIAARLEPYTRHRVHRDHAVTGWNMASRDESARRPGLGERAVRYLEQHRLVLIFTEHSQAWVDSAPKLNDEQES